MDNKGSSIITAFLESTEQYIYLGSIGNIFFVFVDVEIGRCPSTR